MAGTRISISLDECVLLLDETGAVFMYGTKVELQGMPADAIPLLALVVGAVIVAIFSYGAYWAFQVRSALVSRLYRNRALWVGAVGTFLALLVLSDIIIGSLNSVDPYLSLFQFSIGYLGAALTFAWVDTTLILARKSDPLQRNTLHWSKLRIVVWLGLTLAIAGGLASAILTRANYFMTPTGPQGAFLYGPYGGYAIFSVPALIKSRGRAGDIVLRRHLRWLTLFVVVLFFTSSLINNPSSSIPRTIGAFLLIVDAYCLYKAARSLAPLSHVSLETIPQMTLDQSGLAS